VQENGIIAELLPHRHLAEDLADTGSVSEHSIVVASLEHAIPALGIRHNAGGLGKVLEIMQRYHPGHVTQILPMFWSEAPYLYTSEGERRPDVVERESIDIGFRDPVRVYEHTQEKGSRGIRIQSRGISFLMLHHEYLERLDLDLYPCPGRSTNHFLSFFRAWNMAEGVALTLLMTSWPLCLIAYVLQVLAFPRYVLESQQIGSKHLRLCRHRHAPPLKPRISSPSRPRNAAELSAAGESRREAKEHRESGGFAGHETPSVTTSED